MNANDIRQKYFDFMKERGHALVEPAPLVLTDDPTTLFTGSGMQPMIPYLLGQEHPGGTRIVDSQPCLRAQDIEEVGDNRHTTAFEMLGNWSLGDYFKKEQIPWMWEFLIDIVGLDPAKLYVTCFIGAPEYDIEKDTVAAEIWQKLFDEKGLSSGIADIGSEDDGYGRGIKDGERIFYYDGSKNWWSRNGGPETTPIGDPCGPDSEMFYDFGTPHDPKYGKHCHPNCDCGRFMEIGNNVFMAYRKEAEGKFVPLKKPNVDHGSGLERIAAAAIGTPDIFQTSLYLPVIQKIEELSGKEYASNQAAMRIIADHIKGAVWLASQGLAPSNKEQGYVMRRLVRRAILQALNLGIDQNFLGEVTAVCSEMYKSSYPDIAKKNDEIRKIMEKEELVFRKTLSRGLRELGKFADQGLTGQELFMLHDTYGFPLELSVEEAYRQGITLSKDWRDEFDAAMKRQREMSQTAAKGSFKGGLEGDQLIHKKYHTATHLLGAALNKVLGVRVAQRGSHINDERLRLDFSYPEKLTDEQIAETEKLVNEAIDADLPVTFAEYDTDYALDELKAIGEFREKYGDKVTVYVVGDIKDAFTIDVCGGPHVEHTGQLAESGKKFKITKEQSSSAGVRRVKAILG